MADTQYDAATIAGMIDDLRIGMMTTATADGSLLARPMTTQEVDGEQNLWFIVQRSSDQARAIAARPVVNVAYAGKGTWVSVAGRASIVDNTARLKDYWSRMAEAFTEGGPDDPDNVLIKVTTESAEYWGGTEGGAGGRVGQLVRLVKGAVTGDVPTGDNATVDLR